MEQAKATQSANIISIKRYYQVKFYLTRLKTTLFVLYIFLAVPNMNDHKYSINGFSWLICDYEQYLIP